MGASHSSISRRGAIARVAFAAAAGMVAPGLTPTARAALGTDDGLNVFKGRYALRGGRVIDGYFVAPKGKAGLDVVVLLHGEAGLDAGTCALAHRYARAGKLAIVPDMPATYKGVSALAGRDAHLADLKRLSAAFGRHLRGNGKVEFVSA